jgi:hypothetical protein
MLLELSAGCVTACGHEVSGQLSVDRVSCQSEVGPTRVEVAAWALWAPSVAA